MKLYRQTDTHQPTKLAEIVNTAIEKFRKQDLTNSTAKKLTVEEIRAA